MASLILTIAISFGLLSSFVFAEDDLPRSIRETGFFNSNGQVSKDLIPFEPQFPLWTDGLKKQRYIFLPPNTRLSPRQKDEFQFPVGTKLFKEFQYESFDQRLDQQKRVSIRVETRLIEKTIQGWRYGTYVWNREGTDAILMTADASVEIPLPNGIQHRVPNQRMCAACHAGGEEMPLGFTPLQLSDAPVNVRTRFSITLRGLERLGRLSQKVVRDPQWITHSIREAQALGYLAANCSSCHRPTGRAGYIGMNLSFDPSATSRLQNPIFLTVVGQNSVFQIPGLGTQTKRIDPKSPDKSAILYRMMSVEPGVKMPPMGRSTGDQQGITLIREWIEDLSFVESKNHP